MKWVKLGYVYAANENFDWAQSHAYVPTPLVLEDRIRVYTAFWDKEKVGRIGFVDVDRDDPLQILEISKKPVLDIGEPGTFDESGVTPTSIVKNEDRLFLYYFGWQKGVKVRYCLFAGLAIGHEEGKAFTRYSKVPILDRSDDELFLRSAPFVIPDSNLHKMWYVAGSEWINVKGKEIPTYNLRYLESEDGLSWGKKGRICLELSGTDEIGFGRPYVIKENQGYRMWYSIRIISKGYRIGYAESKNGLNWERNDHVVGIDVSESGWDSEMICFPAVVDIGKKRYMFYNGNNYGETGFGVAILK